MFPTLSPLQQFLARQWLRLAISSLAIAGIFSILLVLMRAPYVESVVPYHDFFRTALIVHVDLSVLVWMLSMNGMLWSMMTQERWKMVGKTAFILALMGTLLMALSAFTGNARPLLNNYIPVLQTPVFFIGLSLFTCGILFQAAITLMQRPKFDNMLLVGGYFSAWITVIALLCFALSYRNMTAYLVHGTVGIQQFYEWVFWGGGHILQFTYTQGMVVAWWALAASIGIAMPKKLRLLLEINLLAVIPMPFVVFFYSIDSAEYTNYFTDHMRYLGGIVPLIAFIPLALSWKTMSPEYVQSPERAALLCSVLLFITGGALGHLISGSNVSIPAHYHGSIVGVTLALMGLAYVALPQLGFGKVDGKLAFWQPYVYAVGQLLHISGLSWSGGYGALRKTPGAVISLQAKAGMGLMGLGGLIAVIGGLMFVIVAIKALRARPVR